MQRTLRSWTWPSLTSGIWSCLEKFANEYYRRRRSFNHPPPRHASSTGTTCGYCNRRSMESLWSSYQKVDTFAAASELLTQSLKDVIPQSDRDLLSDPILGLLQYLSLQIMDHLRTQYGVFRATDFLQLISQLEQKVSPSADFSDVASKHRLIFSQFATNGQPISEPQQCQYLSNTIASQPHLVKARDV